MMILSVYEILMRFYVASWVNFLLRCRTAQSPALPLTSKGLAQAGLPLPRGRAQNLQICTNFQASHCPACVKPQLAAGIFLP